MASGSASVHTHVSGRGAMSMCFFPSLVKSKFSPQHSPRPPVLPSSPPPSSPGSLSCVINNSLFCAVPCEWRHTQSQGHGARGDCWAGAKRAGHWLVSRLGAWTPPPRGKRRSLWQHQCSFNVVISKPGVVLELQRLHGKIWD